MAINLGDHISGVFWAAFLLFSWTAASIVSGAIIERITTFAFGILLTKIVSSKSVKGVSLKMIEMYITVFACRLASILFYEGYLPFDSSGDYLYRGMEIAGFFMCLTIALCTITIPFCFVYVSFTNNKEIEGK